MTTSPATEIDEGSDVFDISKMENVDFLSYKISMLSRVLDRIGDRMLMTELGLPLTPMRILTYLHTYKEGRLLNIARNMHMRGSQVSRNMMILVERELVSSHPDPTDRRGTIFRLTDEGFRICEKTFLRARRKQLEVADVIGRKNYMIVARSLDLLIDHYGNAAPVADRTTATVPAPTPRRPVPTP